eukprot:764472-Hanusia_phi.AAC.1
MAERQSLRRRKKIKDVKEEAEEKGEDEDFLHVPCLTCGGNSETRSRKAKRRRDEAERCTRQEEEAGDWSMPACGGVQGRQEDRTVLRPAAEGVRSWVSPPSPYG